MKKMKVWKSKFDFINIISKRKRLKIKAANLTAVFSLWSQPNILGDLQMVGESMYVRESNSKYHMYVSNQ